MSLRERFLLLLSDIRHAFRNMRRAPGFTVVAILTLALGVGANTAIFSVVNGVLLRPLPYHNPNEIVTIGTARPERGQATGPMSQPDLRDIQSQMSSVETVAGFQSYGLTITGLGDAEVVDGATVTDGLLEVFHEVPYLGRDIRADESVPDGGRVVVIGHAFWQERLGGDRGVLGQMLHVEGAAHEIIGVAPPGFDYPDGAQVWVPLYLNTEDCGRGCHLLQTVGRLTAGATLVAARSEATALAQRLEESYPEDNYRKGFNILSLEQAVLGDVRTGLLVLLGAVGMVLLIACANVANLLLARASSRSGEMAMRSALGATRGRITQQLLLEALVLASVGGAAGLALAKAGLGTLLGLAPATLPRVENVAIDGTVMLFTLAAVFAITILFGLAPALRLASVSAAGMLSKSGRGGTGGSTRDLSRSSLLIAEVALSLMLLFGSGLLLRSFSQLTAVDLGFEKERVLTFRLSLPEVPYEDPDRAVLFFTSLEQRISAIPGVESVGSVFGSPLGGTGARTSLEFLDRPAPIPGQEEVVIVRVATPGYHDALTIPLIRGRLLKSGDRNGTARALLASQSLVDRYYPDQDPIGKQLTVSMGWGYGTEEPWTIVGVVGDVRSVRLTSDPRPEIYVPHAQMGGGYMAVAVRTGPGVPNVLPTIRGEVNAIDPNVPLRGIRTMETTVDRAVGPTRFYVLLLAVFAGVALALAAIGLYGVVAYLVSRRTREIGIRIALGAKRSDVVRMVLVQGIRPAVLGIALGAAGAYAGSRVLQSLLYNVTPADPLTLVSVTVLLLAVVVAAILLPAGRASRISPMNALKVD
jgi:predicted permease